MKITTAMIFGFTADLLTAASAGLTAGTLTLPFSLPGHDCEGVGSQRQLQRARG